MSRKRILPGHHGHEEIDEWLAQKAVSRSVERFVSAVLAFCCVIGCFYTAGPVDKTAPFLFYILRVMFGENTCIGFLVLAGVFSLIAYASSGDNTPYKKNNNGNH